MLAGRFFVSGQLPELAASGAPSYAVRMNLAFIREVGLFLWFRRKLMRQIYKRILRQTHTIRLPTGNSFELPIDSFLASEVYITAADIDWGSEALLARMMSGRGAFLDVGANIGYYSCYFQPLASQVFAFEPDPRVRAKLRSNLSRFGNVEIVPFAVGSASGPVTFTLTTASEVSHVAIGDDDGIEVSMITLDGFVTERRLDIEAIKTDVEGFDLEVLKGARQLLSNQRPLVLSELQPSADVFRFAESVGYVVFAQARERTTRKLRFVSPEQDQAADLDYKMLFLIPQERASDLRDARLPEPQPR